MSFELPGILIIHFTGFYEKVCKSEKKIKFSNYRTILNFKQVSYDEIVIVA